MPVFKINKPQVLFVTLYNDVHSNIAQRVEFILICRYLVMASMLAILWTDIYIWSGDALVFV